MSDRSCFVCRRDCNIRHFHDRDAYIVTCARCGEYAVTGSLAIIKPPQAPNWWAISARLRAAHDAGERPLLDTHSWDERWLRASVPTSVLMRLDRLLRLLASAATGLNDEVTIDLWSYSALAQVRDEGELLSLLRYLEAEGRIRLVESGGIAKVALTVRGWQYLDAQPGGSDEVFVAMAFDHSTDAAYDAIRAAIEDDCKLLPRRVDKRHYTHEITEEIVTGLHAAWAVVADVTLGRNGVYFEAGYGMALQKPVIFSVRADRFKDDVHFDTRQYPHIIWTDESDLRRQLSERIQALLARAGRLR